ncbi:MAG: hypothetical protein ACLQGV_18205 [Bryobacteraceae bacterium]
MSAPYKGIQVYQAFSQSIFAALLFIVVAANAVATTFDTSSPGLLFSVCDVNYHVKSFQIPPVTSIPGLDAPSSYVSLSDFDLSARGDDRF